MVAKLLHYQSVVSWTVKLLTQFVRQVSHLTFPTLFVALDVATAQAMVKFYRTYWFGQPWLNAEELVVLDAFQVGAQGRVCLGHWVGARVSLCVLRPDC